MKKFTAIFALLLLACFVLSVFAACDNEPKDTLVIYNWADYIFDDDLTDFKKYYADVTGKDIEITYVTFDTNETMLTRLTKGDSNVDVVCPSEYAIQKLIEMDMLVPMHYFDQESYTQSFSDGVDLSKYTHNSGNVDEGIIDKVSDAFGEIEITADGENKGKKVSMTDYFVPYMYGTLGILYNKYAFMDLEIYDEELLNKANWGILFNDNGDGEVLSDGLTGSILMKDSIRDSYAATVFYMYESGRLDGLKNPDGVLYTDMPVGELINAVDDDLLEIFKDILTEQKSQLFGYEVDFGKDDLLSGNAMVDLAWSGDAMYAVEESWNDELDDYELGYYVPHSTGNIWFDGWVVPKTYNPAHLDAVKLFINYLNRPDVAAANLYEIGYSAATKPDAIKQSDAAKAVLAENYLVYAPELWDVKDDWGEPIMQQWEEDDCDFASWEEFELYFFHNSYDDDGEIVSYDEISHSNWRYPFESAEENADNYRNIDTLGVMRDFGDKNHDVVTAWNYSRSAGVNALPLLGWTALAVALAVGAVALILWLKRVARHSVRVQENSATKR